MNKAEVEFYRRGGLLDIKEGEGVTIDKTDPRRPKISATGSVGPTEVTWEDIVDKPEEFIPSAHTHNASDIIAGILDIARIPNLSISKISNLQDELDNKLDIVIGTDRQVLGFNEDGEVEPVTLGWQQFSDFDEPPEFDNGVLTWAQPLDKFGFVEVNQQALSNTIALRENDGRLNVGSPIDDDNAVNLSYLEQIIPELSVNEFLVNRGSGNVSGQILPSDLNVIGNNQIPFRNPSGLWSQLGFTSSAINSTLPVRTSTGTINAQPATQPTETVVLSQITPNGLGMNPNSINVNGRIPVYNGSTNTFANSVGVGQSTAIGGSLVQRTTTGQIVIENALNSNEAVSLSQLNSATSGIDLTSVTGYDVAKQQTLTHNQGVFEWIDTI